MSDDRNKLEGSTEGSWGLEHGYVMAQDEATLFSTQTQKEEKQNQKKKRKEIIKRKKQKCTENRSSKVNRTDPRRSLLWQRKLRIKLMQEARGGTPRLSCEQLHERRQTKALIETIRPFDKLKNRRKATTKEKNKLVNYKQTIKERLDSLANNKRKSQKEQQRKKKKAKQAQQQNWQSKAKRAAALQHQRRQVKAKTGLTTWLYEKPVHILLRDRYLKAGINLTSTQTEKSMHPLTQRYQSAKSWRRWRAGSKKKKKKKN